MGKHKKEIQEIEEFLSRLRDEEKPIIVEGKKDTHALKNLGASHITVLYSAPHYKIIENIAKKDNGVIILTDLDKKGRQLYSKLNHEFQQRGIHVDNSYRYFLFRKTKIRQIEGLYSHLVKEGVVE